jgi:hypothetical protein
VRDWPHNSIVACEYTEEKVQGDEHDDDTLKTLWQYLDTTVLGPMQHKHALRDGGVPNILRKHPYAP